MIGVADKEDADELINTMHDFATKHKDDRYAAQVLMSYWRGECMHFFNFNISTDACELCGAKKPWRKNTK